MCEVTYGATRRVAFPLQIGRRHDTLHGHQQAKVKLGHSWQLKFQRLSPSKCKIQSN